MELQIKNFDEIMEDMLTRIPDDMDKREGSIIWDALAPAAIELNAMYLLASDIFKLGFIKTSEGEYLTELAFQFGVNRLPATKAIRAAEFNLDIDIGTRFSVSDSETNFIVIEKRKDDYLLECETPGIVGNIVEGYLIPIEYINNLEPTKIGRVIIPGEDEEDDEHLRERTLTHIQLPEQDGNVQQYLKWANEFVGIGNASVMPLWNGPNTVKIIITDSNGNAASDELVEQFQNFLDPKTEGRGEGVAPIGAFVTVSSAGIQEINVAIQLTYNAGYDFDNSKEMIMITLSNYIKKANAQKAFKKYEVATFIDALKEVDYVVSIDEPVDEITTLNDGNIFSLNTVKINDEVAS